MSSLLQQIYGIKWAGYLYFFAIFIFLVPYVAIQIAQLSGKQGGNPVTSGKKKSVSFKIRFIVRKENFITYR